MSEGVNSRSIWDYVLGGILILAGIVVLSHAVIATAISVLFIGWTLLLAGLFAVVVSLFRIGKDGFWIGLLGGGLMAVLGLVMLRNPGAAALTLTMIAGALFLSTGMVRLIAAVQLPEIRTALIISGGISTLLGLMILFNLFSSTFTLLGVLLGVQVLSEGVAVVIAGSGALTATAWNRRSEPAPSK